MNIGKAIKKERTRQELTQAELASLIPLGIDKGYISRVESGQITPNFGTLCMFAGALQMHTSELVKRAEELS